jgi:hypothetical protein
MDARLLDVLIGIASFALFTLLLVGLPYVTAPGTAYLIAIIAFIAVMACAGYVVKEKIT